MQSKTVAALIAGAVTASVGAGAAHALDLRDRILEIEVISAYERKGQWADGRPRSYTQTDKTTKDYDLVAGKVTSLGSISGGCHQSLVYIPGRPFAGTAECMPARSGTGTNWIERSGTATFRTQSAVSGNVLTLRGEMKGSSNTLMQHCQPETSTDKATFTVTESFKVRITGDTCQVLEYHRTDREEEISEGRIEAKRNTYTLAPSARCTLKVRSEQPPPKPFARVHFACK